ncbi:cell cycle checkpoint [Lactarius akahatsu]|uniref:Checkpoint protein n=1 Tax=Lactarius akahatsu TaxID=416441 RepID=A0AAD4Q9R9_9AGAM|nr:cell cycle checkpoint [Lactarius akahatsu]
MRFRATIQNVPTFYRLIQTVEKLQKKCIINFSETSMRIICNQEEGGVHVWSKIRIDALFTDYRILSHSNNEITLNLPTDALSTALRSASAEHTGANEVVMKLAKKKNVPVLSFEIFGTTQMGRRVKVAHDVRIEVMKPADVALLTEPRCPEPDVQIMLPPLTKMRGVIERMRNLSDVIAVRANSSGCLRLSASTEVVKADITWNNCSHPRMTGDNPSQARAGAEDGRGEEDREPEPERPDPTHLFSVLVHARSLLKFLNAHAVSKTTIACICQGHCLILFVYIGDSTDVGGVLTFYIPSVLDD